jgi:hypothetical protein
MRIVQGGGQVWPGWPPADCELELTIRNIAILTNYVEASRGAGLGVITARQASLDEVEENAGAGVWGDRFRAFDPARWVSHQPGLFRQDDEEKRRPGQTN